MHRLIKQEKKDEERRRIKEAKEREREHREQVLIFGVREIYCKVFTLSFIFQSHLNRGWIQIDELKKQRQQIEDASRKLEEKIKQDDKTIDSLLATVEECHQMVQRCQKTHIH